MRRFLVALLCLGISGVVQASTSAPVEGSSYVPTFVNKTGTNANGDFYGTAYGAGVWVKVAGITPYYSTNGGQDWTAATTNATAGRFENVEFLNGRFFALCDTMCTAGKQIQYSDDGMSWTTSSIPTTNVPFADANWNDVAYGNGILVAVGAGMLSGNETANRVLRSTDNGATWQIQTLPQTNTFPLTYAAATAVTYVNGNFIAVGTRTMTSPDGITWTITNSTFLNDIAYGNGVLLGMLGYAGGTNHLYKSTNSGYSWTAVTHPSIGISGTTAFRLRFGNGVFLFGATKFVTTVNGSAFSAATNWLASGSGQWRGLGFGEGIFLAVGDTSNGGAYRTIATTDTPDSTAPTLTQQSPANGATAVDGTTNIVLTFSESVSAGPGYNITIKKVSDNSTFETIESTSNRISIAGSVVTINPVAELRASTAYYVLIEGGAISDLAGNAYAGITSSNGYSFTTAADNTAPTAPSTPDLYASSDTGQSNTDNLTSSTTLTFFTQASENGGTVTITASSNGVANKTCTLTGSTSSDYCTMTGMTAGTWTVSARHEDVNGNLSSSSGSLSVGVDRAAPTLQSITPTRDATNISVTQDVQMVYSEPVYGATGNILVKSGGSTCPTTDQTIAATSAAVSTSGNSLIIDPPSNFSFATTICISFVAGVVKDIAGNNAPLHDPTASGGVRFTTEAADTTSPSASIAAPSSPSVSRTLVFAVSFDESVSGIAGSDFSNTGSASCTMSVSGSAGTSVSVTATCTTDGTVILRLSANSVLDASSNTGPTSAVVSSSVTINTSASSSPSTTSATTTVTGPTTTAASQSSTTTTPVTNSGTSSGSSTTIATSGGTSGGSGLQTQSTSTTTTTAPKTTLPEIDVPETEVGGASALIDGTEVSATITRENNELRVKVGTLNARIWAVSQSGGKVPLDPDGRLRLMPGDSVTVDLRGFDAGSPVEVRLYSDPLLLGKSQVDGSGILSAAYEIPQEAENGDHNVVMIGTGNGKDVTLGLSIAIGKESGGINAWVIILPIGLAILAALLLPVVLRRRRVEDTE